MQVQRVQNNNNYNPNFNGYVHKSLQTFVKDVVKTECNKLVEDANMCIEGVNADKLREIYETGKRVLDKYKIFMKPQHKKSAVKLYRGHISITNPIARSEVEVSQAHLREGFAGYNATIWIKMQLIYILGNNQH